MNEYSIGVCLGASSVSYVKARRGGEVVDKYAVPHNGDAKGLFLQLLRERDAKKYPVVVTGRKFRKLVNLTNISEPEAVEYAYEHSRGGGKYSAVGLLGGETFMVYALDGEGKISNVISKNQCASGTGEFFLQQIKRMDLDVEQAAEIARGAEPFRVSGRCSVFCKSDCTHALNKGTPRSEVTAGLALMIADKAEELLKKEKGGKIMLVGGVTQNKTVVDFLKKKIPEIYIPETAPYFEAFGAALFGLENETIPLCDIDDIFIEKASSFEFHRPLAEFAGKVKFESAEKAQARDGDRCVLGLDVGSTTTKAVIMRESDAAILGSVYLYTNGAPVEASRKCYAELLRRIPETIEIIGLGATGSGRHIAGLHALTENVVNEIVAHAAAAVHFDAEVDTIFEIGGQDAKYTYIVNKVPADYAMNEACSAGTGSFIEETAYESLGIKATEIEPIAMRADAPPDFSDQCAAFINSDLKTAQQENISKTNIIAGLVYSICMNYVNRVKGSRQVGRKIFMQGGVCYNKAVPIAMAALTGKNIVVPPEPGLMGAFGVALQTREKIALGLTAEKRFDLRELADREVAYHKPFICAGGREKCDLRCSINVVEVQGKKYPFGGACDKYYSLARLKEDDFDKYDYVRKRNKLMFEKYAPAADLPENAKTVGVNLTFNTHTLFPLYYNFLTALGFKVVMPEVVDEEGLERENTSLCFPGQLSLGLFKNLLDKNTDYLFIPNILELKVEEVESRLDFNCSCIFVSGEPVFLKQAYKDYKLEGRLVDTIFNFGNGFEREESKFIETAEKLGVRSRKKILSAMKNAVRMQNAFQNELFSMGEEILEYLRKNPAEYAMVIVGRPYNSFADLANKGVPRKFASRGVYALPFDIFDYRDETVDDDMYWEAGKKIMKVAKIIKKNPQLFATYITNFSCAPDSMIISRFRNLMRTKPSLTLELDGHTADAGVNTRIDAAIDIIENYRKLSSGIADPDFSEYTPAKIVLGENEGFYITSDKEKIPLTDPRVKILLPSMGDIASELFAAGMRSQGFNAVAMPEGTPSILKRGRAVATGKECLPLLIMTGSMLDYIDEYSHEEELVAFFIVQGAGNCRLGLYPAFMRETVKNKRLRNVATFELMHEDGFAGLGPDFASRGIMTLIASDVLDDVRNAIMAHAAQPKAGLAEFDRQFRILCKRLETKPDDFYDALKFFAKNIRANVPYKTHIDEAKYIALVGEMFVRRDRFSHKRLNEYFARKGFIVKDAYISEWIFYVDYLLEKGLYEPIKSIKNKVERLIRVNYMRIAELRIKRILAKSGYYKYYKTDVEPLVKHGKHVVPLEFKGEPLLILGATLSEGLEKYCGVVNIGPFGCMQTRLGEAATVPESTVKDKINIKRVYNPKFKMPAVFDENMSIPFLSIETDGNVYPQAIEARLETFALQAARAAKLMKLARANGSSNGRKKKKNKVKIKAK